MIVVNVADLSARWTLAWVSHSNQRLPTMLLTANRTVKAQLQFTSHQHRSPWLSHQRTFNANRWCSLLQLPRWWCKCQRFCPTVHYINTIMIRWSTFTRSTTNTIECIQRKLDAQQTFEWLPMTTMIVYSKFNLSKRISFYVGFSCVINLKFDSFCPSQRWF